MHYTIWTSDSRKNLIWRKIELIDGTRDFYFFTSQLRSVVIFMPPQETRLEFNVEIAYDILIYDI